ncbi:outer membrane protein assembly factor BamB family protein [Natrinema salifodinae]|uniref:Outer membrane protein assembly factor BamB, contains PQQ-like beta-propeller repeat n=1 Tax=Natrinema salifodinae TaxID=1202768 RepID=A0A1I0PFK1_9EURY|nr:PQQ-binding-like beta-propeller repeat protein [Natrinema salifodinae]SEW13203.1 Outer membrane protein assembly factor BamB, contains PQQ-like beta-propeller repeat [Natrinema salifodinae]
MPSRRQLLACGGLAVTGLVGGRAALVEGTAAAALEWPMARYDAAGTGYNPAASGPKDDVEPAWTGALESSGGFEIDPPVLVDGTVYAGTDALIAFDADTGDVRFSYGTAYGSTPARARSSIYRTDTLVVSSTDGLVGLNAGGGLGPGAIRLGAERWRGPSQAAGSSIFGPPEIPPPVAVGDTAYAVIPDAGSIVALAADNGRERWRRTIEYDEATVTPRRPAVRDGTVFVTAWPHQVRAFDAETGAERWRTDHPEQMVLAPTATTNGLLVPSRSGLRLYEADGDGDTRWKRDFDGNATAGAAAVADGRVFVADGTESLRALDLETGEEEWSVPFTHEATPVVADGVVYVTRDGYDLVAFDAETGDQRFTRQAKWSLSTPAIGDGVLYIVDGDRVLALEEAA